jgi:hypothetical protein
MRRASPQKRYKLEVKRNKKKKEKEKKSKKPKEIKHE